jgi:hypothetical protein
MCAGQDEQTIVLIGIAPNTRNVVVIEITPACSLRKWGSSEVAITSSARA